jgi:hypothetical protein
MFIGFEANINNDIHREFINRAQNANLNLRGIQHKEIRDDYTFIIHSFEDKTKLLRIRNEMSDTYDLNELPKIYG